MSITRLLVLIGIAGVLFWQPISTYLASIPINCVDISVPHGTTNVDDDTKTSAESYNTGGSDGLSRHCTHTDGSLAYADFVITKPVDMIHHSGTKVIPVVAPLYTEPTYYGGTMCNDGWISPSSGSGTCSHHHGIAH